MLSMRGFLHRTEEKSRGFMDPVGPIGPINPDQERERMHFSRRSYVLSSVLIVVALCGCSEREDAHTTAITHVQPPAHQVVTIVSKPAPVVVRTPTADPTADTSKPLLIFNLEGGSTFRIGEEVPMSFQVLNAKMKGEGGEYRIRYIINDDDMKWRDTAEPFWLAGFLSGKHTIRVELIGPDGWPYRNGNANVVTREINVEA